MPALQRVVVIVPTYNESLVIEQLLDEVMELACLPDVLVVDDASPDGTAAVVRVVAARADGRVNLLERPRKGGLGPAYAAAMRAVIATDEYDVIVQMDADGSHAAADVDRLVVTLDLCDLAIGSRYAPGGSSNGLTPGRRWLSAAGNWYARLMVDVAVRDLTGGFKAWRSSLLRAVDVGSTASDGYAFQVEMTVRAARLGAQIREVPIAFHMRRAGSSKMNWRIAVEAVAVIARLRRVNSPAATAGSRHRP